MKLRLLGSKIIVKAAEEEEKTAAATGTLAERVAELERGGLDHKAALKQAAREYGIPKREAYRQLLRDGQQKINID